VSILRHDGSVQLKHGEYDGVFINEQQGTIQAGVWGAVFKHLENYGALSIDGFLDIEGAPGVNATYIQHAGGTVTGAGTFALSFHATATLEADFTNSCANMMIDLSTVDGPGTLTIPAASTLHLLSSALHTRLDNRGRVLSEG